MRVAFKIGGCVVAVLASVVCAHYLINSYHFSQLRAHADALNKPYHQKVAALPQNVDSCRAAQGSWFEFGNSGRFYCRMQTRDGGRACTSSLDCEGICIAPTEGAHTPARRACSDVMPLFGCNTQFEGSEMGTVCRD
jgi:hypothetical protein